MWKKVAGGILLALAALLAMGVLPQLPSLIGDAIALANDADTNGNDWAYLGGNAAFVVIALIVATVFLLLGLRFVKNQPETQE